MPAPARLNLEHAVAALFLAAIAVIAWPGIALAQDSGAPAPTATQKPAQTPGSLMPASPGGPSTLPPGSIPAAPPPPRPSVVPSIVPPPSSGTDQGKTGATGATGTPAQPANLDGTIGATPRDVYSEDWWGRPKPVLELHGYFRTRGELYHNFSLGRHNSPSDPQNLWNQPLDNTYVEGPAGAGMSPGTVVAVNLCGSSHTSACYDKSEASADLRFRINPELHISDNLRIMSQIDMLDNVILGSTPDAYAMQPGVSTNGSGYVSAGYNGYAPLGVFSTTQGPPTAGINGYQNSIQVNRVWGEYMTPVGQLRFGRMPNQWGLGMVNNAGDGIDSDYQTTVDRIMFVTGIKSVDLYFGGSWDFVSTGTNNSNPYTIYGGQPYSNANLENVNEWMAFIARRTNPEKQKMQLAQGDSVLNGGLMAVYRSQLLDVTETETGSATPYTIDTSPMATSGNNGLQYRGAWEFIPDLWVQALWKGFRFEAEFSSNWGQIAQTPTIAYNPQLPVPILIREYGLATQTEYKAIDDKLHLNFGFGWASGDPWAASLNPGSNPATILQEGNQYGPLNTFAFHPDYRVDLIFFREILTRVEGAYYFRPSVDYDFIRQSNGQKFGGGGAVIWSRASDFEQTPGHKRDLGVELDLQLYYNAADGTLNDDPTKVGGFFAMLQYGVFFPLGGLSYLPGEQSQAPSLNWDLSTAQTVRLFLGVVF
jgi:uncharacterized protein (TIGR04551 family)